MAEILVTLLAVCNILLLAWAGNRLFTSITHYIILNEQIKKLEDK